MSILMRTIQVIFLLQFSLYIQDFRARSLSTWLGRGMSLAMMQACLPKLKAYDFSCDNIPYQTCFQATLGTKPIVP
jgi:hypothetical protein